MRTRLLWLPLANDDNPAHDSRFSWNAAGMLQESPHVFASRPATGKRPQHGRLLRLGSGRIHDVPQRLPLAVPSDDARKRRAGHIAWLI